VAVVEIEEARAIGRELELAAGELKRRVVPLFVDGEYEVSVVTSGGEPTIRLVTRVSDGKKIRTRAERSGLTQSEATASSPCANPIGGQS
jgi:hypothetical protein